MAVAALVLGIVSIVLAFTGYGAIGGIIAGVVGIVLAVQARKQESSGVATGGLVTSIIGTVLSAILLVSCVVCVSAVNKGIKESGIDLQKASKKLEQQMIETKKKMEEASKKTNK